jgi:hypothetical protein
MSEHTCRIFTKLFERDEAHHDLFQNRETGDVLRYCDLPPGALYEDRYPDHPTYVPNPHRPDDKTWTVKLPCGTPWMMDCRASSGGYWTRTGEAPNLSMSPSIHITTTRYVYDDPTDENKPTGQSTVTVYHGYLTNGKLTSTPDSPC